MSNLGIQPDECEHVHDPTGAVCHLAYGHDGDHCGEITFDWPQDKPASTLAKGVTRRLTANGFDQ